MNARTKKAQPISYVLEAIKDNEQLQTIVDHFNLDSVSRLSYLPKLTGPNPVPNEITWTDPTKNIHYLRVMLLSQQIILDQNSRRAKKRQQKLAILLGAPSTADKHIDLVIKKLGIALPEFDPSRFSHLYLHKTLTRLLELYDQLSYSPVANKQANQKNKRDLLKILHDLHETGRLDHINTDELDERIKLVVMNFNNRKNNWQRQEAIVIALRHKYNIAANESEKVEIASTLADLLGVTPNIDKNARIEMCDEVIHESDIYFPSYYPRQKRINRAILTFKKLLKKMSPTEPDYQLIQQTVILLIQDNLAEITPLLDNIKIESLRNNSKELINDLDKSIKASELAQYKKLRSLFQLFLEHRYIASLGHYFSSRLFDKDFFGILKVFNNTVNHDIRNDTIPLGIGRNVYMKVDRIQELYMCFEEESPADPKENIKYFCKTIVRLMNQVESTHFKDYGWKISSREKQTLLQQLQGHFNQFTRKHNIPFEITLHSRPNQLYHYCLSLLSSLTQEQRKKFIERINQLIYPLTPESISKLSERKFVQLEKIKDEIHLLYKNLPIQSIHEGNQFTKSKVQNQVEYLLGCIAQNHADSYEYKRLYYLAYTYIKTRNYAALKKCRLQLLAYTRAKKIPNHVEKARTFNIKKRVPPKMTFKERNHLWLNDGINYLSKTLTIIMAIGQGFLFFYELMGLASIFGLPLTIPFAIIFAIYFIRGNYTSSALDMKNFLLRVFVKRDIWFGFQSKGGKLLMAGIWLFGFAMMTCIFGMTLVSILGLTVAWPILAPFTPLLMLTAGIVSTCSAIYMLAITVLNFANFFTGIAEYLEETFPEIVLHGWGFTGLCIGLAEGLARLSQNLTLQNIQNVWKRFTNYLKNPTKNPAASRLDIHLARVRLAIKAIILPLIWILAIAACAMVCVFLAKSWNAQLTNTFNSMSHIVSKITEQLFKIVFIIPDVIREYAVIGLFSVLTNVFVSFCNVRTFHHYSIVAGNAITDYVIMPLFVYLPVYSLKILHEFICHDEFTPNPRPLWNKFKEKVRHVKNQVTYFFRHLWSDPHQTAFPVIDLVNNSPLTYPAFAFKAGQTALKTLPINLDTGGVPNAPSVKTSASFIKSSAYREKTYTETFDIEKLQLYLPVQDIEQETAKLLGELYLSETPRP